MSTTVRSDRYRNGDDERLARLRQAEIELLQRNLGAEHLSNNTRIQEIDVLEGDKDYHFLFNFLPDTEVHRYNLNINYEGSDIGQVIAQSGAKLTAAKEYYLEKADELNQFWNTVMPSREMYHDLVHLHNAKRYRLQRIVKLLNREIEFNKEVEQSLETKELNNEQEEQIRQSYKRMDTQRELAQSNYLKDSFKDFRIPFFEFDMPAAEARIRKEMFLIKDVVLKDLNTNFYEAYNETIENHIKYQVKSKQNDTSNPELSKLYGYMSQYGLNLKNKFLDVFNDKVEHGTITEESLEESLTFFNNNYGAIQERLFPAMVEAVENGASFEELMNTKTDEVSSGFSGLKEEFDSIYSGLLEHAEGKKTIADLMREKATRVSDLHTNGKVSAYELAQNIVSSRQATFIYDKNYDLDNDGDVDDTDIAALNDVLKSKNGQFERYNNAYDKFDVNNDGIISADEATNTLTNYIHGIRDKENDIADVTGDGVVNGHDLKIIKNIVKADLGVDFDIEGDQNTVIQNIMKFTQDTAERRLELWDMADAKLEEYYESAGQTYGARRQYYYRFLQTKWGDSHQRMGGAYIDSMLTHLAAYNDREDRSWFFDQNDPRAAEFNERLQLLNAAMDESLEIHTKAATKSDEHGNKWYGDYARYDDYIEDKVMSSLEIQKHRAATYGLFYKDADDNTTAQVDKLFDLLEVTYADYYNNRHNWTVDVNEENSLSNIADDYEEHGRNRDVADVAISTLRSVHRLIYRSRYRGHELTQEQDNIYNEGLQEYVDLYVDFREKIQAGDFTLESSEAEDMQDKLEAKYDLLINLGNLEENTTKAVAFVDKDGDGKVSAEEKSAAQNDFDYAMKMQQILHTNDFGISEEGEAFMNQYDFNGDGLLDEADYDVIDNVTGISREFPIHNLMNIISKQTKVKEFLDARIALEDSAESTIPAVRDFLESELQFDQAVKDDYWKVVFRSNENFANVYENIEKLRIQVMDQLENGEDASEAIAELNGFKEKVGEQQIANARIEPTVGYLKFLDELEGKSGQLVNKFLMDQEFFTPEVRDALEYIQGSSINTQTLVKMLIDDPENFIETVGYLKAAEKLELTDNFDQILAGELGDKQIKFLKAIGQFTESRDFIANQDQNELFIQKLVDKFFGDGNLNTDALDADYSDYIDLMVKYTQLNSEAIDDDAQVLIDELVATLYNSNTLSTLTASNETGVNSTFTSGSAGRRYLQRGTYGNSTGNSQANENFYENIKKIFQADGLDSIASLKGRDSLLSKLNLAEEDSDANKEVAKQYIQEQIEAYQQDIEAKQKELEELGNSRFNVFAIRRLKKQIQALNRGITAKTNLQGLFA